MKHRLNTPLYRGPLKESPLYKKKSVLTTTNNHKTSSRISTQQSRNSTSPKFPKVTIHPTSKGHRNEKKHLRRGSHSIFLAHGSLETKAGRDREKGRNGESRDKGKSEPRGDRKENFYNRGPFTRDFLGEDASAIKRPTYASGISFPNPPALPSPPYCSPLAAATRPRSSSDYVLLHFRLLRFSSWFAFRSAAPPAS